MCNESLERETISSLEWKLLKEIVLIIMLGNFIAHCKTISLNASQMANMTKRFMILIGNDRASFETTKQFKMY